MACGPLDEFDEVTWRRSASLAEDLERLKLRAVSAFEHMSEEIVEAGFAGIEAALPSLGDGSQYETSDWVHRPAGYYRDFCELNTAVRTGWWQLRQCQFGGSIISVLAYPNGFAGGAWGRALLSTL